MKAFLRSAVVAALAISVAPPPPPAPPAPPPVGDPYDRPAAAAAFARAKRLGGAGTVATVAAYESARRQLARWPVYSTRLGRHLDRLAPWAAAAGGGATWQWLGPGNIGGRTRVLAIDPERPRVMYAGGVSGGVWKSVDAGASWRPVADDLENIAVNSLALDPANPAVLYAGTGEGYFREEVRATALPLRGGGIFASRDGGRTWARLESTRGRRFHWVNDLAVSRHDGARLYAATRRGIFRSLDGGDSWRRVLRPRSRAGCLDLELVPDPAGDFLLASCGSLGPAAVYRNRRAEGRGGWEKVLAEPGMGRTSLAAAPSRPETVYALAASNVAGPQGRFEQALHAVFRSDAGGAAGTWRATVRNTDRRKINTQILSNPVIGFLEECGFGGPNEFLAMGWYVNVIAVDPRDPETVWAGGVDLLRSDDGGRNWNPVTYWWANEGERNYVHADHHGLVFHPRRAETLYSLNDGGIYRTDNASAPLASDDLAVCRPGAAGVAWQSLNRNYGVTQFYHGTPLPGGRAYLGGAQDNGTLRGDDTAGPNAWRHVLGGDGGYSAVDPRDPRIVYATIQNGEIRKSVDGGATFARAVDGIDDLQTNDSSSFRAFGPNFLFIAPLELDANAPDRLWSGGRRLWRTDDGAAHWRAASAPLAAGAKASAIAVAPGDSDRLLVGTDGGAIHRQRGARGAGGATVWEASRPRAGFVSSVGFDPLDPEVTYATYAGFGGRHVWRSLDGGATWASIDGEPRLPDLPVHDLAVDPADRDRLWIATDLGVLVSLDGGATWAVEATGFARAVTESLTLIETASEGRFLFAFTHGRGAWRLGLGAG